MKGIGLLLLAAAITVVKTAENACQLDTAENGIIQFTAYPVPPGSECLTYTATVSVEGYNVDVAVEYLELDDDNGDYLIISPGSLLVKDEVSTILTGTMTTSWKLRVMDHGEMFVMLVTQKRETDAATQHKGFRLSYRAFGQLTTELPTTSPRPTLPSAPSHIDDAATVYVAGIKSVNFTENVGVFKDLVARTANIYCTNKNIELQINATAENVVFHQITSCPITWPQWETCTKINMKVAVFVPNNHGYELIRANILEMWNTYADKELQFLHLHVYKVPDNDSTLKLWLYIAGGVVIIFTSILILAWWFNLFNKEKNSARNSFNNNFERVSVASTGSWISSTYQEVPPMTEYGTSPSQDLSSAARDTLNGYVNLQSQDLPLENNPTAPPMTLTLPQGPVPSTSEGFGGAYVFGNINPAFDISSEEQPYTHGQNDDDDSDDEIPTNKMQLQDQFYKGPTETDSDDDDDDNNKIESTL